jgi:hypothetical protein
MGVDTITVDSVEVSTPWLNFKSEAEYRRTFSSVFSQILSACCVTRGMLGTRKTWIVRLQDLPSSLRWT